MYTAHFVKRRSKKHIQHETSFQMPSKVSRRILQVVPNGNFANLFAFE